MHLLYLFTKLSFCYIYIVVHSFTDAIRRTFCLPMVCAPRVGSHGHMSLYLSISCELRTKFGCGWNAVVVIHPSAQSFDE